MKDQNTRVNSVSLPAVLLCGGLAAVSFLAGFAYNISAVKKNNAKDLAKYAENLEPGWRFASRAFGIATIISCSAVIGIAFTGAKLFGLKSLEDLRVKGDPNPETSQNFSTVRELVHFLEQNERPK